ncbi:MAG: hypothetical protein KatS3mg115_1049 [Candidatus Poribacteria bacterium]|nr:MAG: hypothetical protein KatS3mg115_1049 [Candidatus Poribacteria bacterium]
MRSLRRLIRELRRKGFHFTGVIIPSVYCLGLKVPPPGALEPWLNQERAVLVLGVVTGLYFLVELIRLLDPELNRAFVRQFRFLLRRSETHQVTGTGYYLLGAWLSVVLFPPTVAIAAMSFLIFGDVAAALVGMAIGRVRILGNKTLEGSLACFVVCVAVGIALFSGAGWPHALILALTGATVATTAELLPLWVNDNLTIPLLSGAALWLVARAFEIPIPAL